MREAVTYAVTLEDGTVVEADAGRRLVLALEDAGIDILHR